MRNLYILLFLLFSTALHSQIVDIPDINFKNALIEEGVDTNNDGEIQISEAEAVVLLNVNGRNISSLEGIGNFVNIEELHCSSNQLTTLDMSLNINLQKLTCIYNQLTYLNVAENLNLTFLWCQNNQLSELNGNNLISSIDISQNLNLKALTCSDNSLSQLDLSQHGALEYLECADNQLIKLIIDNGNNQNLSTMISTGNPALACIQVDDEGASRPECDGLPLVGWCKDEWTSYREDCSLGLIDLEGTNISIYPNPVKNQLFLSSKNTAENLRTKIFILEGQLVNTQNLEFENQTSIDVSTLAMGFYFLKVENDEGKMEVQKFLKE